MLKLDFFDFVLICFGGSFIIVDILGYFFYFQESEIIFSNSKDSGIQRDVSFYFSSELIKVSKVGLVYVIKSRFDFDSGVIDVVRLLQMLIWFYFIIIF